MQKKYRKSTLKKINKLTPLKKNINNKKKCLSKNTKKLYQKNKSILKFYRNYIQAKKI